VALAFWDGQSGVVYLGREEGVFSLTKKLVIRSCFAMDTIFLAFSGSVVVFKDWE
jgi:hypothetical protein